MAYLVVDVAGERREVPVQGPVTIGRQKGCTFAVDDKKLSREHTRFFFDGRVYMVQDLESKNGTYLNGQLLREARMLRPGDKIRLGDVAVTFHLDNRDANVPADARGPATKPDVAPAPRPSAAAEAAEAEAARERREQVAAHARAVQSEPAGPGAFSRLVMNLVLLAAFGAGVYGFKLVFAWALVRVVAK